MILLGVKLKQQIQKKLGPLFFEKGFIYDELNSRTSDAGFVYCKGEPLPSMECHMKYLNGEKVEMPHREEIRIYKSKRKILHT